MALPISTKFWNFPGRLVNEDDGALLHQCSFKEGCVGVERVYETVTKCLVLIMAVRDHHFNIFVRVEANGVEQHSQSGGRSGGDSNLETANAL